MALPLIRTKFIPPNISSNMVHRARILETLDHCLQPGVRLALVSAPAGFGKTTLLAQWVKSKQKNLSAAWLSLDENDNQFGRFFAYLLAALNQAGMAVDQAVPESLELSPDLNPEQMAYLLVNRLCDSRQNLLLVMDDYHLITLPAIHQFLSLLVERLPDTMRLVLAGRIDPPIPLARLRARGQLIEIRTLELRFNNDEAVQFISQLSQASVFREQVGSFALALNGRTEGWAAGLQMSALALRGELLSGQGLSAETFLQDLSGSQRYILDYLLEEVLGREKPEIRDFLLKTSILEKVSASSCAALLKDASENTVPVSACQEILEYLERANLFLIPLDQTRTWYRYHHLFGDVLQKQLLNTYPGLAQELHRRVAGWFESQGMVDDAIHHVLRGNHTSLAVEWVEKHTLTAAMDGKVASALRWIALLPIEIVESNPRLCLNTAWALAFTPQGIKAVSYLDRASRLVETLDGTINPDAQVIQSEALGLKGYHASVKGRAEEAIRLIQKALEIAPDEPVYLRRSLNLFLAGAWLHQGNQERAMAAYQEYLARHSSECAASHSWGGLAFLQADFLNDLAFSMYANGKVSKAIQFLKDEIQKMESKAQGAFRRAAIYLYVGLGKIMVYENELDAAESYLETAISLDPLIVSFTAFDGLTAMWRIQYNRGDQASGRAIIDRLLPLKAYCDESNRRAIEMVEAMQNLLEGHVDRLAVWAERNGFHGQPQTELAGLSDGEIIQAPVLNLFLYSQYLLLQDRLQDSLFILNRIDQAAKAVAMPWVQYRAWVRQAVVYAQMGNKELAMQTIERCLAATYCLEGNPVRVYLENGEPIRQLLEEAARRGLYPEFVARLLAAFPQKRQENSSQPDQSNLVEPLTERELEVLHLMAQGLRGQEIADRLYVSLNTIRYHSRNIFGKLDVNSRTAAVSRARELGLM